ncbi:hypothetical protein ATANTOWER_017079 [Ataeniobius toweri]|uniref:Uncharacterized protein n=1 Tax=Ataeniobius toweri TaxID=208326 RepID=A0ABU7CH08_9TELE|nr:hypothetical protein [Ataeniobius toweri]
MGVGSESVFWKPDRPITVLLKWCLGTSQLCSGGFLSICETLRNPELLRCHCPQGLKTSTEISCLSSL